MPTPCGDPKCKACQAMHEKGHITKAEMDAAKAAWEKRLGN